MIRLLRCPKSWLATPLILLSFFLMLDSMVADSPTMDEQNHLARGLAFLRTGDPRFSLEHPPLVNSLSALPLLTLPDIRLPTDHPSWERAEGWYEFADLLLWQYNHDVERMIFLARMPILFLTIGMALVGYRFALELWGQASAWVAFFLLLFEPNIIAHGRYTTTDVGGTAFLLLAFFLLWRLWQVEEWAWSRWLLAGAGLAAAFGSKLSTLAFTPIMALVAVLPLHGKAQTGMRWQPVGRRLLQLFTAGMLSLVLLWAIYGFQWGPFLFRSPSLSALNAVKGPMPTFWAGIEQIVGIAGGGRGNAFLLGKFSDQGFPAYFPVAYLSKTPLPILVLLPIAVVFLLKEKSTRRKALFLLLPALLFFLLSMQSKLTIGYRHLLPIVPLLILLIGGLARIIPRPGRALPPVQRLRAAAFYLLVAGVLVSDILIHPHYLSYFNAAAGGPENGYNILVDSNIDWGQDLLRLKRWMAENQVPEVNLAWFGSADPRYYGIQYRPLPGLGRGEFFHLWWDVPFNRENPEPGVYAISVSNLWELPLRVEEKSVFAWFRAHQPDDRIGYSIFIYRVP